MASRAARHRFDPVSFVLGAVALTAGLIVLGGGSLLDDAAVLLPAGLIALGVAILLQVGARREEPTAPVITPPTRVAGPTLSGAELYDLLVPDPTEEFLAELAERERTAGPPGGEHPVVGINPGPGPVTAADPTEPAAAAATGPDLDPAELPATPPIGARAQTIRTATPGARSPNRHRRVGPEVEIPQVTAQMDPSVPTRSRDRARRCTRRR